MMITSISRDIFESIKETIKIDGVKREKLILEHFSIEIQVFYGVLLDGSKRCVIKQNKCHFSAELDGDCDDFLCEEDFVDFLGQQAFSVAEEITWTALGIKAQSDKEEYGKLTFSVAA